MIEEQSALLEFDDIQGPVLRKRPLSYFGAYFLLRIDNLTDGREMLRRLAPKVVSAADWQKPGDEAWINVALTFPGLEALGVPQASLESFSPEFQQGLAARAEGLGDVDESAPANWEKPFGTQDVHVMLAVVSGEEAALERRLDLARSSQDDLPGVSIIYQMNVGMLPTARTHLGYKDSIGDPLIEGNDSSALPGQGPAIKAGEFIFGYPDETGNLPPMPQPEALGRNGTYLAFRKLHSHVAEFRKYLRANADTPEDEALLQAKMVGRWPSGAPLVLAPERDDPELGADPQRNNDFGYYDEDPKGLTCPAGSHIRRNNPRDARLATATNVNLHRVLRRGFIYGPMLPEGATQDDGVDRGIMFAFLGAYLERQFEFVKTQWQNDGNFVGLDDEKDPISGPNDGTGTFTVPRRPVRRRLHGIPRFMTTKGGEYCFMPSIRALHWLADLDT
ncbi:MAG TPA: Dyp-type peroxidase [Chloroflexia bacterium]|nr:Dyp-type peroxidase [Chloroflexia bacterium]